MSVQTSETVLRADIHFAEKDKALRDDVRRLGRLVGDLVKEQGGEALYDVVEAARRAAIAHREGDERAIDELKSLLAELAPRTATDLIRAFSTYFQMVNMAEKVHRIRRRRAYQEDSATPQPFGFVDTLRRLKRSGVGLEAIEATLQGVCFEPVFTAHATEVTRRTLLRKQQRMAQHLIELLSPYLTPPEKRAALGQIRLEMTTGWQTEDHTRERRIGDETEHVLFFLTDVLYRVIPPFYESLEDALTSTFGDRALRIRLPLLVRFGSWVGGDMDGHPSVTAKSIRQTLARQRSLALDLYHDECAQVARSLSQSDGRIGVAQDVRTRAELYAAHFPKAAHAVPSRHRNMPYRVFLRLISARLQATFDDAAFPYESPEEFIEDIESVADSLRANHGHHAGLFLIKRLLRRARTFGFHIATLDIRQRADVHRRVVGEALNEPGWSEMTSAERTARLTEAFERRESPSQELSSEGRRTVAVFQTIAHCRRKYGKESIGPYIVSMAHGPDDVLSVLLLARWGHLGPKAGDIALDVAPLFETAEDLGNAADVMRSLLRDERYRTHLRARGDHQMIMLGFADSHEDGGVVSGSWTLHVAQQALVETLAEFNVRLTLFHGRGGMINRAGGRLHDAVFSTPRGAVSGRLRTIELGERINARYGLRGIATRTLEQTLSALLSITADPPKPLASESRWQAMMSEIAAESRRAYEGLVNDPANFDAYFRSATPVDIFEHAGLGKLRTHGSHDDSDAKVAAGWEFAWTQNRCLMPEWYGFAAGVALGLERFGETEVTSMFEQWPFAHALLGDIEISLAKADLDIAEQYSELAGNLHALFFPKLRAEYDRCVDFVLRLTGQKKLLETADRLRRAIRLRNPYVDPMSYLQVDLLKRWRESGREDEDVQKALLASINGIAHGMQNTG